MAAPTLYLFVGYPGSGKTTVAQIIHESTGAVHLWADYERQQMFENPTHSPDESRQLYEHLNDKTAQLLAEGKSVIFDTNFNFRKDRDYLRHIAENAGANIQLIWITTPVDLARQRAVEESENQATRLFGNMPQSEFTRISGNLEPPAEDEKPLKLDGTKLDTEWLKTQFSGA